MRFRIVNSDQGHLYVHYVNAPDKQTAMERFKAGHYGEIIECEEDEKSPSMKYPKITAALLDENNELLSDFVTAKVYAFSFERIAYRAEWDITKPMVVKSILFNCIFEDEHSFQHIKGNRQLKEGDTFVFTWWRHITSVQMDSF